VKNGGRLLKRGDSFDIECWRTTHRLRVAHGILLGLGIKAEWEHSDYMGVEYGVAKHLCDDRCKAVWAEWVSDEMFNLAYSLACEVQDKRGAYHRREAWRGKVEREKAEREKEAV
jgi:hypothetical protein